MAPFTVFAPTNSAFAKIDNATLTSLLADPESLQTGLCFSASSAHQHLDVAPSRDEMCSHDVESVKEERLLV